MTCVGWAHMKSVDPKPMRTIAETAAYDGVVEVFEASPDPTAVRLDNFPRYVRRQSLTRFLVLYELFKRVLDVKGSIIECGVNRGFGLMSWAKLSAVLEPVNLTRRIYGFDTFSGFPAIHEKDSVHFDEFRVAEPGGLGASSLSELTRLLELYDQDRFLGHMSKVELIAGDALQTIPQFMRERPHLVVSLLFLDFDLYEPTRAAIEAFVPRMPRGSLIAFDELDNPKWPGETTALVEGLGIGKLELRRLEFDPYVAFATIP